MKAHVYQFVDPPIALNIPLVVDDNFEDNKVKLIGLLRQALHDVQADLSPDRLEKTKQIQNLYADLCPCGCGRMKQY